MSNPQFQFHLASPSNSKNGYITLGEEKVHFIDDVNKFYRALGYTEEIRKTKILPEEFIWSEYRSENSKKTKTCLQIKIIEYLSNHSPTFKSKYADYCKHWIDTCNEKWMSNLIECEGCTEPNAIIKCF